MNWKKGRNGERFYRLDSILFHPSYSSCIYPMSRLVSNVGSKRQSICVSQDGINTKFEVYPPPQIIVWCFHPRSSIALIISRRMICG